MYVCLDARSHSDTYRSSAALTPWPPLPAVLVSAAPHQPLFLLLLSHGSQWQTSPWATWLAAPHVRLEAGPTEDDDRKLILVEIHPIRVRPAFGVTNSCPTSSNLPVPPYLLAEVNFFGIFGDVAYAVSDSATCVHSLCGVSIGKVYNDFYDYVYREIAPILHTCCCSVV